MNLDRPSYRIVYGGQAIVLPLRLCDDGYISGYERAGVEQILQGYAGGASVLTDPDLAERFFPVVLDLSTVGPLPWRSWLELDADILEQIARDFFVGSRRKTERLTSSSGATSQTAIRLKPALDLIFASVTWLSTTSSTPPADSETSTGPGTTAADSPSSPGASSTGTAE